MKIAITADCHLNRQVYKNTLDKEFITIPFRSADYIRSLKWIVDQCIEMKPDLFVIAGDIYDYYEPTNELRGILSFQLSRLAEAKIATVLMTGNHDICKKHHALKDLQELNLKSLKIVDKPYSMVFKKNLFLFFPYSLDIEQKNKTTKEEFTEFVNRVKANMPSDIEETFFFGHFAVKGAKLNTYKVLDEESMNDDDLDGLVTATTTTIVEKTKNYLNQNAHDITVSDLDSIGAKYVFLGDYHEHQFLSTKKCYSMYCGSIEKSSFNEKEQDKGFVVYDSEVKEIENYGKSRFVKYPNSRTMLEFKGNLKSIYAAINEIDASKYQGSIVKVYCVGSDEELMEFSVGLKELLKTVDNKFSPVYKLYGQKLIGSVGVSLADVLEQKVMDQGHIGNDDVIKVVEEMIKERFTNEKECKRALDLAHEIYQSIGQK